QESRRNFLRMLAGTGGAAAVLPIIEAFAAEPETVLAKLSQQAQDVNTNLGDMDVIERMRIELSRALQKTPAERHWVMVIDLRKCVGCHACTVACIAENKLPPGVVYRPVIEEEIGTYPNVARRF